VRSAAPGSRAARWASRTPRRWRATLPIAELETKTDDHGVERGIIERQGFHQDGGRKSIRARSSAYCGR